MTGDHAAGEAAANATETRKHDVKVRWQRMRGLPAYQDRNTGGRVKLWYENGGWDLTIDDHLMGSNRKLAGAIEWGTSLVRAVILAQEKGRPIIMERCPAREFQDAQVSRVYRFAPNNRNLSTANDEACYEVVKNGGTVSYHDTEQEAEQEALQEAEQEALQEASGPSGE